MSTTQRIKITVDTSVNDTIGRVCDMLGVSRSTFYGMAGQLMAGQLLDIRVPEDWKKAIISEVVPDRATGGFEQVPDRATDAEVLRNRLLKPGDSDAVRHVIDEIVDIGPTDVGDVDLGMSRTMRKIELIKELHRLRSQTTGNTSA
jgi:hypothetical protein